MNAWYRYESNLPLLKRLTDGLRKANNNADFNYFILFLLWLTFSHMGMTQGTLQIHLGIVGIIWSAKPYPTTKPQWVPISIQVLKVCKATTQPETLCLIFQGWVWEGICLFIYLFICTVAQLEKLHFKNNNNRQILSCTEWTDPA